MTVHPSANRTPCHCAAILAWSMLSLSTIAAAAEPAKVEVRVEQVLAGLRPPVSFVGDTTWSLSERMAFHGVPGVAISVIDEHGVAWTRTYGLADRDSGEAVDEDTLFQAGSVSKPVAAFGAMRMVEDGRLKLATPVNAQLNSWKIPDNAFTQQIPVTLSHLLSHTGGLTVHGFAGYAVDDAVPSVLQILDGQPPANSEPVRVDFLPGSRWRYSGGGYTIAQLLMTDVADQDFPALMQALVLKPIGMRASSYVNPLPSEKLAHAAAGVLPDRSAVPGKRHTYPEMAAAGLWTTSADLALFAIEMQKALAGKSELMKKSTAQSMLKVQADVPYGRGFGLSDVNGERYFGHGGWDEGFCAQLTAHRSSGQGVVIMINANQPAFMNELQQAVAFEYGWPGYREYTPIPVGEFARETAPGRYRINGEQVATVSFDNEKLFLSYAGDAPTELVPVADDRYLRRERAGAVTIEINSDGDQELAFEKANDEWQRFPLLKSEQKLPRELLLEGQSEAALAAYRQLRDAKDEAASEDYLNRQGIDLARRGRLDAAIKLLALNTELYPESANTWDSLGYAWLLQGDKDKARSNYEKALEIEPAFPSAKAALEDMRR